MGEAISLLSGRDLEPQLYNANNVGIPYITGASNIVSDTLIINRWTEFPETISKEGDLLLTCKGTIGTLAFNNIGDIHIARQIMAISSGLNMKYIQAFLNSHIQGLILRAKSMIPGISRADVLSIVFPLPPLSEQQRIVAKIEELMPLVEQYGKAQSELETLNSNIREQLKKSILQYAIEGKLVPQCEEDGTAEDLLREIQTEKQRLYAEGKLKKKDLAHSTIFRGEDNKYYEQIGKTCVCIDDEIPFEIPKGWVWCIIGDLFLHNNGKQLNKGNSSGVLMKYITTSNLYWDGFRLDSLKTMPFENKEIERCQALKGDLLVCEGGDIGRSCIWEYDRPIMLQNHIHKLRAYIPLFTKYFYYIFYLYNLSGIIGGKGIGIQGFSSKALHNTRVPLPPLAEQKRISNTIANLLNLLSS